MLVIKFRIGGLLRFLSHAQTLSVFQRACVRAGLQIQYSQGLNPRPRLSLPLPRPVGVASDDEMLCIQIQKNTGEYKENLSTRVHKDIVSQLPQGFELLSVNMAEVNTSFQPCSAQYILTIRKEYMNEQLKANIKNLMESESIDIERQIIGKKSAIGTRGSNVKNINVRGFLESIELDQDSIIVTCRITPAGSIRVEEILSLLRLDVEKLALPIRRTNVVWKSN